MTVGDIGGTDQVHLSVFSWLAATEQNWSMFLEHIYNCLEHCWLRASSSFHFWKAPCCPWCSVWSLAVFLASVDFNTPVISASWQWLVLGGWFSIYSTMVILSVRVTSLLGISAGIQNFKCKNCCTSHSRIINTVTARLTETVARCSFMLSQCLIADGIITTAPWGSYSPN